MKSLGELENDKVQFAFAMKVVTVIVIELDFESSYWQKASVPV